MKADAMFRQAELAGQLLVRPAGLQRSQNLYFPPGQLSAGNALPLLQAIDQHRDKAAFGLAQAIIVFQRPDHRRESAPGDLPENLPHPARGAVRKSTSLNSSP